MKKPRITIEKMNELANNVSDITGCDIRAKKRTNPFHFARTTFMYVARKNGAKLRDIGEVINRDHSTVIYALKTWPYTPKKYHQIADQLNEKLVDRDEYVDLLLGKIDVLKSKIENPRFQALTQSEIMYRCLSHENQLKYDERVKVILRMMQ